MRFCGAVIELSSCMGAAARLTCLVIVEHGFRFLCCVRLFCVCVCAFVLCVCAFFFFFFFCVCVCVCVCFSSSSSSSFFPLCFLPLCASFRVPPPLAQRMQHMRSLSPSRFGSSSGNECRSCTQESALTHPFLFFLCFCLFLSS